MTTMLENPNNVSKRNFEQNLTILKNEIDQYRERVKNTFDICKMNCKTINLLIDNFDKLNLPDPESAKYVRNGEIRFKWNRKSIPDINAIIDAIKQYDKIFIRNNLSLEFGQLEWSIQFNGRENIVQAKLNDFLILQFEYDGNSIIQDAILENLFAMKNDWIMDNIIETQLEVELETYMKHHKEQN